MHLLLKLYLFLIYIEYIIILFFIFNNWSKLKFQERKREKADFFVYFFLERAKDIDKRIWYLFASWHHIKLEKNNNTCRFEREGDEHI
jgi:hypothetical protein